MTDELWQDEVYTLVHFASKGFFYPFLDYHLPNNHMLFSALLAKWWFPGCSTIYLRTLPLCIFLITLIIYPFVATRIAGRSAAFFALFFFGVSPITQNFALQIRGYSVSWLPILISLLSLATYVQNGIWYWGLAYVFASAISVAIIPTNIFFCGIFVVWGWIQILFDSKRKFNDYISRLTIITIGPLLGFIAYAYVLNDFFSLSQKKISPWRWLAILKHWFWATSFDFIFFLPVIGFGFILLFKKTLRKNDFSVGEISTNLSLIVSTFFIVAIWVVIFPNPPFPRNFVPFLPVWFLMAGYLASLGFDCLFHNKPHASKFILLVLMAISIFSIIHRNNSTFSKINTEFPQDLRRQYYHENFYPSQAAFLLKKMAGNGSLSVLTDYDGIYCLGYLLNNSDKNNLKLLHYKIWKYKVNDSQSLPRFVVTHSFSELKRILNSVGISSVRLTIK
ncbi:hypothetical protein [uncultured Desulfosarcina sp.]|uniref:hypothetical protein n=1 Tax=uncultured Desulfosarcina sp. TaxID=218289 RepID=UPI0029C8DD9D|nr:hypothetical protein [uncultured Desulfosarcina sp.]